MGGNSNKKEIEYEFCIRCGKRLKEPEYRILGLGPVCYEKMLEERKKLKLFKLKERK